MITLLHLPSYTIIYYYSTILKTEREKSFQQNGDKKDTQRNYTAHALGQIYRACGKKMAPDSNRPHGVTHVWKSTMTFIFKISARKDWKTKQH